MSTFGSMVSRNANVVAHLSMQMHKRKPEDLSGGTGIEIQTRSQDIGDLPRMQNACASGIAHPSCDGTDKGESARDIC